MAMILTPLDIGANELLATTFIFTCIYLFCNEHSLTVNLLSVNFIIGNRQRAIIQIGSFCKEKGMAEPVIIDDSLFEEEVLNAEKPVLVDFWAEWCGPCHMIAPYVKQIAEEQDPFLKVAKLDIDDNPITPGRYGIMGIPTLILFKKGEVVARITGALPKDRILAQILPHLETATA
jgi:thioredoxin 1